MSDKQQRSAQRRAEKRHRREVERRRHPAEVRKPNTTREQPDEYVDTNLKPYLQTRERLVEHLREYDSNAVDSQ